MLPRAMLTVIALSGAVGVSLAHLAPSQNALSARGDMPPGVTIGSDGYPDPVTLGHFFVHTAVHVRDMAAARRFYGDMLGMRHVASVETPERDFAITMMGHGQGGRNGTGFMTGPEFVLETTNLAGLIELIYSREWSEKHPHTIPSAETGLSHLGLVVLDAKAAQTRLSQAGYTIVKPLGAAPDTISKELAIALGVDSTNRTRVVEVFNTLNMVGFVNTFHVADPDGNIVEVNQQTLGLGS